jgi:hypothetical protein
MVPVDPEEVVASHHSRMPPISPRPKLSHPPPLDGSAIVAAPQQLA